MCYNQSIFFNFHSEERRPNHAEKNPLRGFGHDADDGRMCRYGRERILFKRGSGGMVSGHAERRHDVPGEQPTLEERDPAGPGGGRNHDCHHRRLHHGGRGGENVSGMLRFPVCPGLRGPVRRGGRQQRAFGERRGGRHALHLRPHALSAGYCGPGAGRRRAARFSDRGILRERLPGAHQASVL